METFDDGSQTIKSFEVFFSVGGWCLGLVVCLMVVGWLNSSYATQKSHSQTRMCDSASDIHPNLYFIFFQHKKCKRVAYVMWVLWWLFSSNSFSQSWKMKNSLQLKRWFVYSSVCLSDLISVCRYDHPKVWLNFNTL